MVGAGEGEFIAAVGSHRHYESIEDAQRKIVKRDPRGERGGGQHDNECDDVNEKSRRHLPDLINGELQKLCNQEGGSGGSRDFPFMTLTPEISTTLSL